MCYNFEHSKRGNINRLVVTLPRELRSLILRAREGDSLAFEHLRENFHASIFSLLCKWTGNWHDAEDLTQETFIRAFKYLKTFRIDENFKTWLYRIVLNLAHDHYKHQRCPSEMMSLDEVLEQNLEWSASAPDKIFQSQLLKIVYGILSSLTPRERGASPKQLQPIGEFRGLQWIDASRSSSSLVFYKIEPL